MFYSNTLNNVINTSKTVLENYSDDIKKISDDITKLEAILHGYGIHIPYEFKFNEESVQVDVNPNGLIKMLYRYEYLAWEENKSQKNRSYRLIYKMFEQSGYQEVDDPSAFLPILLQEYKEEEPKLVCERPLIETSSQTRVKSYAILSEFLANLINKVSVNNSLDPKVHNVINRLDQLADGKIG